VEEPVVVTGVGDCLRDAPAEALHDLRREFERTHHIRLSGFFEGGLTDRIAAQIAVAEFEPRVSEGVGSEWLMKPNALGAALNWLLNTPDLLEAVGEITGCDDLGYFAGRVYRLNASSGQSLSWHDDRQFEDRRLAISVNLGTQPHAGGVLRIREKAARDNVFEAPNVGAGDAVLFRVADELEHSVTPIEGAVPRIAFTGWFMAGPSYYAALLEQLAGDAA
jgi:hypothetical protein